MSEEVISKTMNPNDIITIRNNISLSMESKYKMFESCMEEVGIQKTFPYFDYNRYKVLRVFKFPNTYPIDKTEETMMRNCVKRNMMKLNKMFKEGED